MNAPRVGASVDKVHGVDYQRNGISGEGFYTVDFEHDGRRMLAVVFPEWADESEDKLRRDGNPRCAVIDPARPWDGWRGDRYYEGGIATAVEQAVADGSAFQPRINSWDEFVDPEWRTRWYVR